MSEQKTMNVIGFFEGLPIESTHSFIDQKEGIPVQGPRDLLVKIKPSTSKGVYMKNIVVSSTMGPSIKIAAAK